MGRHRERLSNAVPGLGALNPYSRPLVTHNPSKQIQSQVEVI